MKTPFILLIYTHTHTKHSDRKHWKGLDSNKISNPPILKQSPPLILPSPPFLWEKSEPNLFVKISKTQTNPFTKGFQLCTTLVPKVPKYHKYQNTQTQTGIPEKRFLKMLFGLLLIILARHISCTLHIYKCYFSTNYAVL